MRHAVTVRAAVLRWYARCGRDLPWRRTRDPYAILVSEIMLQQTQVDRVVPRFSAFLARFPTARALAGTSLGAVLREWSGLGYNRRARNLWECAKIIAATPHAMPDDLETLRSLPGIGRYTAAAVACFAFDRRVAVVDTNIRRVLGRCVFGEDLSRPTAAWQIAEALLPRRRAAHWHQALMDIGARHCRRTPQCTGCPLQAWCAFTRRTGNRRATKPLRAHVAATPFVGSPRYYRGRIVKALVAQGPMRYAALGEQVKPRFAESDLPWLTTMLHALAREGLIVVDEAAQQARLP